MNKKTAFTLSEILITLGIIGVVSMFTIPTLLNNYHKRPQTNKPSREPHGQAIGRAAFFSSASYTRHRFCNRDMRDVTHP